RAARRRCARQRRAHPVHRQRGSRIRPLPRSRTAERLLPRALPPRAHDLPQPRARRARQGVWPRAPGRAPSLRRCRSEPPPAPTLPRQAGLQVLTKRRRYARGVISIVVPVYNEEPSLRDLLDELAQTLDALGEAWEVIVVDDGSTDGTFAT